MAGFAGADLQRGDAGSLADLDGQVDAGILAYQPCDSFGNRTASDLAVGVQFRIRLTAPAAAQGTAGTDKRKYPTPRQFANSSRQPSS